MHENAAKNLNKTDIELIQVNPKVEIYNSESRLDSTI
jgi:hypothetical protein